MITRLFLLFFLAVISPASNSSVEDEVASPEIKFRTDTREGTVGMRERFRAEYIFYCRIRKINEIYEIRRREDFQNPYCLFLAPCVPHLIRRHGWFCTQSRRRNINFIPPFRLAHCVLHFLNFNRSSRRLPHVFLSFNIPLFGVAEICRMKLLRQSCCIVSKWAVRRNASCLILHCQPCRT